MKHTHRVVVLFRLGSELLAVDASAVQEITLLARLSTPSGLPSVLAGFLNLADRPIPIVRLHRLLDLSEPVHGLYTQILILRDQDGNSVGWIVDRVVNVLTVRQPEIMTVPENQCFKDCTEGVFTFNDLQVSIIAPGRVLLEKERQCVNEFRDMEQERLRELARSGS
ncbi:MAG: purine-binding chemotaxis protein CheW [Chthoniobacter sp.]|nr:purine-binding chemotaxis protein CheW [Chthoniobacter sp.]